MFQKISTKRAPISAKTRFNQEDDKALTAAVQIAINAGASLSNLDWGQISSVVPGKSSRQCRERWQNYLNPNLSDKEWTTEEDQKLMSLYQKYGQMWTQIAHFFNGRTGNSVRNRYMKIYRRQSKLEQMQFRAQYLRRAYPYLANCDWEQVVEKQKVSNSKNSPLVSQPPLKVADRTNNENENDSLFQSQIEDSGYHADLLFDSIDLSIDSFYDSF